MNQEITVGSRVRWRGIWGTVREINQQGLHVERDDNTQGGGRYVTGYGNLYLMSPSSIEEIINSNIMSNSLLSSFKSAFLTEPEKTFRKAGVTNDDGLLTQEGLTVFLAFLLKKHGDEFKKDIVDKLLTETVK